MLSSQIFRSHLLVHSYTNSLYQRIHPSLLRPIQLYKQQLYSILIVQNRCKADELRADPQYDLPQTPLILIRSPKRKLVEPTTKT